MQKHKKFENHKISNAGFLRAAVLGANDGLISTSSLIVGMAASGLDDGSIIKASVAALFAGAASMAAGEYVSVSSQFDLEDADISKEKLELEQYPQEELVELRNIYEKRGLSRNLAEQVAQELTKQNALEAHLRDELGITELNRSNPLKASIASGLMFSLGSLLPILVILITKTHLVLVEVISTVVFLFITGAVAAYTSNAKILKGSLRVMIWGMIAMFVTYYIGGLFS